MNYSINNAPLTWRHIRIVAIASLGQLIGTGLATLVSVIIPLYQIISHQGLSSVMQGIVGSMNLIGIMIGSAIIGRLSDKLGYILFFRLCPALVCIAAIVALLCPTIPMLIVCLFVMGFGIGGEYSLDSDYISELMPAKWVFTMVGVAKAASALGNIVVAAACFIVINGWTDACLWPRLLWIVIVISGLMVLVRIRFWESPKWLMSHGETLKAETVTHEFLGKNINITPLKSNSELSQKKSSFFTFIKENWKNVIFTGIPWACEGLGVYGIGVFLPILVMELGMEHISPSESPIAHVASSVESTLWISCIILPGFIIGLLLLKRMKGVSQQWIGFILSAVCLIILLCAYKNHWTNWIMLASFMGFELFLNLGPHLMTYILPTKIYPVEIRGQGSGIAASIGKLGAVAGVFCIPLLLKAGGSVLVLMVSAIVMLTGALVTYLFAPSNANKQ